MFTKRGPKVHAESKHVRTALHFAVEYNRSEEVISLLKTGADINAEDETGSTPLHFAAVWCDNEVTNILIKHGAIVDSKTKEGKTALHVASRIGNEKVIATLLENGASINDICGKCIDECGGAAIHFAVEFNHPDIVQALVKANAEIDLKNIDGMSPLHIAAKRDNCEMIELLLKLGANINVRDSQGKTPLMISCIEGNDDAVNKLFEKGADVNIISEKCTPKWIGGPFPQGNGGCALQFAVMYSRRNILMKLLSFGADVETKNLDGASALHTTALVGDADLAQILIESGANIDSIDNEGRAALHVASSNGNMGVVTLLIEKGANVNMVCCDKSRRYAKYTALHFATEFHCHEVILALLSNGANLEAKDALGRTPLHLSALSYSGEIAGSLLTAGAYVDPKDNEGHTPLYVALINGNVNVLSLLLRKGADTKLANAEMQTEKFRFPHIERFCRGNIQHCCLVLKKFMAVKNVIDGMKVSMRPNYLNVHFENKLIDNYCKNELIDLKRTRIGNFNLTYYSFLKKSVHEIRLLLKKNVDLRSELSNFETLEKQFPLSGLLISNHYYQGMYRLVLMDKFNMDTCEAALKLPYYCVHVVLDHLTNEDLIIFGTLFPKGPASSR